jgi:hypothetical protein
LANKGIYQVVWPKGKKTTKATSLSKRLDSLNGKTVGLLWDYVFQGDIIFKIIQGRLSKEFSDLKFVSYDNFGNIHDKDEAKVLAELPATLAKYGCDAVISAVGC